MRIKIREGLFCGLAILCFNSMAGAEEDPFQGLPPGEGRELVLETCTACHSTAIILQNRMTRERWDRTLTWMQEKQGLERLAPETRRKILDYLESTRGLEIKKAPGKDAEKPSPHGSPIYEFNYRPNPL